MGKTVFKNSEWIWIDSTTQIDTYTDFYDTFVFDGKKTEINISADSNYVLFINGKFVDSGQYPDFPHYKVYDRLDITEYCKMGENSLAVTVWYYGLSDTSTYYKGKAGVCYEVLSGDTVLCFSDRKTLSRLSPEYENGCGKMITSQLGLSFMYYAAKCDNWKIGVIDGFSESTVIKQETEMFERPVKKLMIGEKCETVLIKSDGDKYFLYDIGREEVGYFTVKLFSEVEQKITVCYGEHISDGCVRRKIGGRDFSFEIVVGKGYTDYTNYFRRLGLRYIEIHSENAVSIEYASVLPCAYPINIIKKSFNNSLINDIYNTSVRTLYLCMHDHYEDCPWREQALYAMDSRNQMLCGYCAFGEYSFPRANLYLMSKDNRSDGLLSICVPSSMDLTIPSFSLHYFTAVYEYTFYSGDTTLVQEIMPKLTAVLKVFTERMENGLVPVFTGSNHWNFYEWSNGLDGAGSVEGTFDAALNCLLSIALDRMDKLCRILNIDTDYKNKAESLNLEIHKNFYNEEDRLFADRKGVNRYSELVNSLAVLCGAADKPEAEYISNVLCDKNSKLTAASLSMRCFKYDALLETDKKYSDYVLNDIAVRYKSMLDAGATSFWETEAGESDFDNAGSLCHGWSAMPVYYYCKLIDNQKNDV